MTGAVHCCKSRAIDQIHHDNTLNDAIVSAASNETKQNYVSSYSCSSKATRASNCEEEVVESEVLTSSFYCAVEAFSWADFALEIDEKCYVGREIRNVRIRSRDIML